jgi:hypothetical protein
MTAAAASFYVTGGTLPPGARSYVRYSRASIGICHSTC